MYALFKLMTKHLNTKSFYIMKKSHQGFLKNPFSTYYTYTKLLIKVFLRWPMGLTCEQVELLIELQQLEGAPRSPALLFGQSIVNVSFVFGGPTHIDLWPLWRKTHSHNGPYSFRAIIAIMEAVCITQAVFLEYCCIWISVTTRPLHGCPSLLFEGRLASLCELNSSSYYTKHVKTQRLVHDIQTHLLSRGLCCCRLWKGSVVTGSSSFRPSASSSSLVLNGNSHPG